MILTDTSVLVICKFIATATLTSVTSQHIDTHRIGATVMKASGTFIDI